MINTLICPFESTFLEKVANTKESLLLCAPFIKESTIKKIIKVLPKNIKLEIFTASIIGNFIKGASDISALLCLKENNATIYNYQTIHAKVYMFDNKEAIITSGNLTHNGLNKNFEYGICTNESNVITSIINDYDKLKNSDNCTDISKGSTLENILKTINDYRESLIITDSEDDSIIYLEDTLLLSKIGNGWKRLILKTITSNIKEEVFTLEDVYKYENYFKNFYPDNKHIKDKIRQSLQQLRDCGFLKFMEQGKYKKLYKVKK